MKTSQIIITVCLLILINFGVLHAQRKTDMAVAWYNKGNKSSSHTEKVKCYKRAIELIPTFIEAHYYLGHVYKNTGRFPEAIESYKNALSSNPPKLNDDLKRLILFELGMVYMKLDRLPDAKETFINAVDVAANNGVKATIYNMLGNICYKGSDFDKAVEYYQQGIEAYPINKTSFETSIAKAKEQKELHNNYNESLNLIKQNKYTDAITMLEKIASAEPNFKDVNQLIDSTKLKLQTQKAAFDIKRFYDHGLACIKKKDWKNAVEAFELVIVKQPDYEDVKSKLALAQKNLKAKMKNDILKRYYDEGNAAVNKGDYMNAIISYERVSEINPNYKNIQFKIKQLLRKTDGGDGQSMKSKYYKQGMKAFNDEDWQTALNNFNRVYALDNSYQDVQAMMQKAKKKVASNSKTGTIEIYYQKGLDYFSEENWLYALINFEKVNMLDPNYKEVVALISQARQNFEGTGELAEASAVAGGSTNPILIVGIILSSIFIPFWAMVLFSPTARARFYLFQKKYGKAGQIYERMIHNNPGNVKLYMTLANIYMNENRTDEYAISIFKKVIESDLSDELKRRLVPILNQHYLEQGKINDSQIGLLEDSLKEELKNMGN